MCLAVLKTDEQVCQEVMKSLLFVGQLDEKLLATTQT